MHQNHPKCGVRVQTLTSPEPVLLNPVCAGKPPEKLFRDRDAQIPPPRHPGPGGLGWSLGLALVFMLPRDCDMQLELGTTALVQRFSKSITRDGTSKLPENLLKLPMPRPTPDLHTEPETLEVACNLHLNKHSRCPLGDARSSLPNTGLVLINGTLPRVKSNSR